MYVDYSFFVLCVSFLLVLILAVQIQARSIGADVESLRRQLDSLKSEDGR